jgi:hypothetical protein
MPTYAVGQRLTAALLQELSDRFDDPAYNPTYPYVKQSATNRVNNTLADDDELVGIALAAGTYHIRAVLLFNNGGSATPDIKTQWAFSGTWNNPNRICTGPATTNTGNWDAITPMKYGGAASNVSVVYGVASSAAWSTASEETLLAEVTIAGNLSLQWAQNTTDAVNATILRPGSAFLVRQIA